MARFIADVMTQKYRLTKVIRQYSQKSRLSGKARLPLFTLFVNRLTEFFFLWSDPVTLTFEVKQLTIAHRANVDATNELNGN